MQPEQSCNILITTTYIAWHGAAVLRAATNSELPACETDVVLFSLRLIPFLQVQLREPQQVNLLDMAPRNRGPFKFLFFTFLHLIFSLCLGFFCTNFKFLGFHFPQAHPPKAAVGCATAATCHGLRPPPLHPPSSSAMRRKRK